MISDCKKQTHVFLLFPIYTDFSFCFVQEMGVIGPDNQLPNRRTGRKRGGLHSALHDYEDGLQENFIVPGMKADEHKQQLPTGEDASNISEALSLFPQPKSLLSRVLQVATSSNRSRVCISHPLHNESKALFYIDRVL